jgi:hypothetical protein
MTIRALLLGCAAALAAGWAPHVEAADASFGHRPGERVPELATIDIHGQSKRLLERAGPQGLVLFLRDVECPVSQRYTPAIRRFVSDRDFTGYRFVVADVTPHAPAEARRHALSGRNLDTIVDPQRRLAAQLRAETTAEVFVIDERGTLRYRGAIDDQYGITFQKPRAEHAWLRDAMRAIRAGDSPAEPRTQASGCAIAADPPAPAASRAATYHNRISRIIQARCETCHRVGGMAPMPLQTYRQVYERRAVIEAMVTAGLMPPWSARRGVGHWANDRSLSEEERGALLGWIRNGAPQGDAREAPRPRRYAAGWTIGKPDAVLPIPEAFAVPAEGMVAYKNVFVKTGFAEDRWVSAVEVRPTQPKAVHHVLVFLEEPGRRHLTPEERKRLGAKAPPEPVDGALGFFAATVPGAVGTRFPPGTAKLLPRGAWLRFEIHYQPMGKAVVDRTEIGLRFAHAPMREVKGLAAPNTQFVIPPFARRHVVSATHHFGVAGELVTLFPHMHLRGAAFSYDLKYPDGRIERLLDVPRFDFNWQSHYEFATPLAVPAGSQLIARATYDNSKDNPWNPDPSQAVRWGPLTTDEMMIGYFDFVEAKDPPPRTASGAQRVH